MTEDHKPLPVQGYTPQSDAKVALVNEFKQDEERLLRKIDAMYGQTIPNPDPDHPAAEVSKYDMRWAAVARTHFQEGFMALNRAVFQPQRIKLPEDDGNLPGRQTSPEVAALAGKYLDMPDDAMAIRAKGRGSDERFFADIRKLAASALGQVNP
jgi:hypothetical protein